MKQFVRIASFITAIIMFFVPVLNASAVTIDSTQTPLNEIDAQFFTTQASSIKKYNDILNAFSASAQMLSDQKTSSKTVYPDNYGGAYIDSYSGRLVILVANDSIEQFTSQYEPLRDSSIIYKTCDISYNKITETISSIAASIPDFVKQGIVISTVRDDIIHGNVIVHVEDLTASKEAAIRKIFNFDFIIIENSPGLSFDVGISGGTRILSSLNEYSTLGFPATRYGVSGFVVAGHAAPTNGISFSYQSNNGSVSVGTSTGNSFRSHSTADAAFISAASTISPTNYLASLGGYIWDAYTEELPVNTNIVTNVTMTGGETGYSVGEIVSNNGVVYHSGSIVIENQYVATYQGRGGDSGAPVLIYDGYFQGTPKYTLIGIHCAHEGNRCSYFSSYANIVNELNVQWIPS